MKKAKLILLINLLILSNLIYYSQCEQDNEDEFQKRKSNDNKGDIIIENDDEFDDPTLLSAKKEKLEKKKKKEETKEYKENKKINENKKIQIENTKNDEIVLMNKYKYFLGKYFYEIIMIVFIVIFIINAVLGYKANKLIANKWMEKCLPFFDKNYAHLGADREYNPSTVSLIKESYNEYKFFASGRVNISWMLVDIYLKKRQDLISSLSRIFLFNEKDKIAYEASISPSEDIPCIFAITKKSQAKTNKKNYNELNEFTSSYSPKYISDNFLILTENEEIVDKLFSDKSFYNQYKIIEKYIDFIFFTDRRKSKEKHGIVLSFELKGNYDDSIFVEMSIFVHMLIDVLCSINIKSNYVKEASIRRKEYEAKRNKETAEKNREEVNKAKDEKKMAEQNKPMTREQMQKQEEKERKEFKKGLRKKFYKVVKA